MSEVYKDLGGISAYALAVSEGYTGTKEEFALLMSSYATVAEQAAASATAAAGSATSAAASATSASGSASVASEKATEAEASATTANTAATTATEKAEEITGAVEEATEAADTATGAAEDATEAAETASDKATEASGYATSAQESAESAEASAQTVSEAVERLEEIDHKAPVIISTASGAIATFADGADDMPCKSVVCEIDAVQDLHGQDAPYPAGGGKNKLPKGVSSSKADEVNFVVNDEGAVSVTTTPSTTTARFWGVQFTIPAGTYILSGCPSGGGQDTYYIDIRNAVGGAGIAGISADTGSGSTFTITEELTAYVNIRIASGQTLSNKMFYPMIRLSTVSDATYAPYSNICPITGWDGVTVNRCGKNFIPTNADELEQGSVDGYSGADTTSNTRVRTVFFPFPYDKVIDSGYKITIPSGYNMAVRFYDVTKTFIAKGTAYSGWIGTNIFDSAFYGAGVAFAKFVFRKSDDSAITPSDIANLGFQLELGSTATAYEPYSADSHSLSFPQTVYGGWVDVIKGVLTVDKKFVTAKLSDMSKQTDGTLTNRYTLTNAFTNGEVFCLTNGSGKTICNMAGTYAYNTSDTVHYYLTETSAILFMPKDIDETLEMQVVATLTTPITISINPVTISTLLGNNNVYCNTGDTTAEYHADTKLYIDGKFVQLQALILES